MTIIHELLNFTENQEKNTSWEYYSKSIRKLVPLFTTENNPSSYRFLNSSWQKQSFFSAYTNIITYTFCSMNPSFLLPLLWWIKVQKCFSINAILSKSFWFGMENSKIEAASSYWVIKLKIIYSTSFGN